jgi:hypothetical protein
MEAEKWPLLEAVIRKCLVKTENTGVFVTVICKEWRSVMAL